MEQKFVLNSNSMVLSCAGVDVFTFSDDYACGHQSGINLIMHDRRMINGGDIRFEQTPGQWQPLPRLLSRSSDEKYESVTAILHYPDESQHLKGFNPIIYPDFELDYSVSTKPYNNGVLITVSLKTPIPEYMNGKASFIMEMYPGYMMGCSYLMDNESGFFPTQPNGPTLSQSANIDLAGIYSKNKGKSDVNKLIGDRTYYSPMIADDIIAEPYATGHHFTACPESELYCFSIHSENNEISLYDGRMNHNNGWFVICSSIPTEQTGEVLSWYLEPKCKENWLYSPVVATSQVGYHPKQKKVAIIECDKKTSFENTARVFKITALGKEQVKAIKASIWGDFFRYTYVTADFSDINEEGLYQIDYMGSSSNLFKISDTVFDRGVWQPVIEYFLPVQMCHMLVREKYRTWHGICHNDDAIMARTDFNHFDGYSQGPDTLCKFQPGEHVPGLNSGGWHDAGDYDLRIESQTGELYNLALIYECFKVNYDATTIDQTKKLVEIHRPDGKNDILQQIEHGLLTVVGGYEALGRLYRGIICSDMRQYVLLGDGSTMTDGIPSEDDRWVFTEDNPITEFETAGRLSAAYRVMKGFNDELAEKALNIAIELYDKTRDKGFECAKLEAAAELYLSTRDNKYKDYLINNVQIICDNILRIGWVIVKTLDEINDDVFTKTIKKRIITEKEKLDILCAKNPYGVPIFPRAWGAGWDVQMFAMHYYFMYKAFPDILSPEPFINAINFVLGCHYGRNTASFASGIGVNSATVAYCANRADYSFIPGGVVSGTELISPDFPEYLMSPFIWQQSEYVLGLGSTPFMFLVLAVIDYFK